MNVAWTPAALDDRRTIFDYIENENPIAALAIDELIEKGALQISRYPMTGRPGRVSHTRELVIHRHYVLIYDVVGEAVRILRVLHTARKWPSHVGS